MFGIETKLAACVCGSLCLSVGGYCCYRNRAQIPHPSECGLIGKVYFLGGCHKHTKLDLMAEIHEARMVPKGAKVKVRIVSGRFSDETSAAYAEDKGRCDILERLNVHVRQCDEYVEIISLNSGSLSSSEIGRLKIDVENELVGEGFPKRREYILKDQFDKSSIRLLISFHNIDSENVDLGGVEASPLVRQALLQAQYEAENSGEKLNIDLLSMTERERLSFYSKVLEGPLQIMSGIGGQWSNVYVRPSEKKDGTWLWSHWKSKQDCTDGAKPIRVIPLLSISVVLPDTYDRTSFYIKHHTTAGAHDLVFKRVDRDRDMWSDGMYEFIDKLRAYLESNPLQDRMAQFAQNKLAKESKKEGKRRPSRSHSVDSQRKSSVFDDKNSRRMASPRESALADTERVPTDSELKPPSSPRSTSRMSDVMKQSPITENTV
eukprot:GHVQ01005203.1.p1 GENE.GHVQ01005203.1~~GHVQ01005203.1.p1  ORF type:complete len:433 (-),score=26.56 GHVQ01005203.1:302-1600(-)